MTWASVAAAFAGLLAVVINKIWANKTANDDQDDPAARVRAGQEAAKKADTSDDALLHDPHNVASGPRDS